VSYDKERYATDPAYRERRLASNRRWNKANSSKMNARRRLRLATDPRAAEVARGQKLWFKYGLSLEEFERRAARQNGLCAICVRKPRDRLCVDHSHDTHMLRDLLCRGCNRGLGNYRDDPVLLRAAADYAERWQRIHARLGPEHIIPMARRAALAAPPKPRKRKDAGVADRSAPRRQQGQPPQAPVRSARPALPPARPRRAVGGQPSAGRPQPHAKGAKGRASGQSSRRPAAKAIIERPKNRKRKETT
jgi:hypothetical protein